MKRCLLELTTDLAPEFVQHGEVITLQPEQIGITEIAPLESAGADHLAFLSNPKFASQLATTRAAAVLVSRKQPLPDAEVQPLFVRVDDPYVGYARVAQMIYTTPPVAEGISGECYIHPSAQLGGDVAVAAGAHIDADAVVGDGAHIGAGAYIGRAARVGAFAQIKANVTIHHRCVIGERVIVHSGTVIGCDGFGYANDRGRWLKIPQVGAVIIGDDTEIGANCAIDRGALDNTVIGVNVIIDNLVHIAHNVVIDDHSCICGTVGIAGSTHIGKYVVIAGGCSINGHISICDNVQITGASMVTKSITSPGTYSSNMPVQPNPVWQRNTVRLRQIDKLYERVKQLEQQRR